VYSRFSIPMWTSTWMHTDSLGLVPP